jgi:hypothetical protein
VLTWANPAAITYGTALGAAQFNAVSSVPGAFAYSRTAGTVLNAGNSQAIGVIFTPTDTGTYVAVESNVSIDVLRAALTITADNKIRPVGSANPLLTASYTGFVNGETVASLDAPAVLATTAVKNSPLGIYPITVSGASDVNYAMTFTPGTLTVRKSLSGLSILIR